jgi:nucleotide-binding universal stress UspA family protein
VSYVSLMVHVDADRELGGRIGIAADLIDRFHAPLIGVAAWAPMSVFLAEEALIHSSPTVPDLQDMKSVLDHKGQQFCKAIGKRGREVEWRSGLDFPTEVLAREARAADLVIIGNERENRDPFRSLDPAGFLLKAGRPVLVVPASVRSFSPKRIGIAWKDAREARRAVHDSLPFLQQAESVTIIQISETNEGNDQALHNVKDVARYLNRHRVETIDERVRAAEISVTDSLLRMAREENIDLIVAGAYGHSRLGEWVFGGVTRELLVKSPFCCLFSH